MAVIQPSLLVLLFVVVTCYGKAVVDQKHSVISDGVNEHEDRELTGGTLTDSKFKVSAEDAAHIVHPGDLTDTRQVGGNINPNSGRRRKHGAEQRPNNARLDETGNDDQLEADDIDDFFDNDILSVEETPTPKLMASDQERTEDDTEEESDDDNGKDTFHPVKLPTKFESYDLMPADGFITLGELVNVTGARVNVRLAFNDSDKNGDGLLDRTEFYSAPWKLNPNYQDVGMQADDSNFEDDDDATIDMDDLFGDDLELDEDDWEDWEDEEDYWNDMDDADVF